MPRSNRPRRRGAGDEAPELDLERALLGRSRTEVEARRPLERAAARRRRGHEGLHLPRMRPRDRARHGPPGGLARRRPDGRGRRPGRPAALAHALLEDPHMSDIEIAGSVELPARREDIELHTERRAHPRRRARACPLDAPAGRDPGLPAPAADARRLHGLAHPAQGGRAPARRSPTSPCCGSTPAARRRRAARRRAPSTTASTSGSTWPPRWRSSPSGGCRSRGCSAGRSAPSSSLKYGRQHPIAGAILLSPPLHRATADDVAALGGSGRPARRDRARVRRLPAPAEAAAAVRVGAERRAGRRRGRQAPLGRREADRPRADRDRRAGQPGRVAAAHGLGEPDP